MRKHTKLKNINNKINNMKEKHLYRLLQAVKERNKCLPTMKGDEALNWSTSGKVGIARIDDVRGVTLSDSSSAWIIRPTTAGRLATMLIELL